jgi:hypothetical protein
MNQLDRYRRLRPLTKDEAVVNRDGSRSTERTHTVEGEAGSWTNIPSLWMDDAGEVHDFRNDEEGLIGASQSYKERTGGEWPSYGDMESAVEASKRRSAAGGVNSGPLMQGRYEDSDDPAERAKGSHTLLNELDKLRNRYPDAMPDWLSQANDVYLSEGWDGLRRKYTPRALKVIREFLSSLHDETKNEENTKSILEAAIGFDPMSAGIKEAGPLATLMGAMKRKGKVAQNALKRMTDVPSIRGLPVDEALKIARREPHLIPSGDASQGAYVGGPRNVMNKRQLNSVRNDMDAAVADEPRGADWYDRYRADVDEVTGGNKKDNDWMSAQHGQFSAGVSPDAELGFVIKENNANLMGKPVKAARPAQYNAQLNAIAAKDPSLYQLGKKTGVYADHINPGTMNANTATGVNDFRAARSHGRTEADGTPQKGALGATEHTFMDFENALAIDRANTKKIGGRSDWTGEKIQAAPWVRQKGNDFYTRRKKYYDGQALRMLTAKRANDLSPEAIEKAGRELSFQDANRTIGDFFPKHTLHATHEAQPGVASGHLPGAANMTPMERLAFAQHPASTWATAPGGRDAIYSGLRIKDTGVAARVRPTAEVQGIFDPQEAAPHSTTQARLHDPLLHITLEQRGAKSLAPADRDMAQGGEMLRAYIDAQDAGAGHVTMRGGTTDMQRSARLPLDRKTTDNELLRLRAASSKRGLPDVVDTGEGVTFTDFNKAPGKLDNNKLKALAEDADRIIPGNTSTAYRVKVDGVYADLADGWAATPGSGTLTRDLIKQLSQTPQMRAAFNNNPYIAERALAKLARDEAAAAKLGATRKDLQNARRVIGDGPGWIDRLEEGLKRGAFLPSIAVFILGGAAALSDQGPS